jgi:hypothetical protein
MQVSAILEVVALVAVAVLEVAVAHEVVAVLEADQVAVVLLIEVAIDLVIVTQVLVVL